MMVLLSIAQSRAITDARAKSNPFGCRYYKVNGLKANMLSFVQTVLRSL